jgi:hypothetical protein
MRSTDHDGLRILAQYERRTVQDAVLEFLRVDGQGLVPRADPKYCVQVTVKDDPGEYRVPVPPEFNRQKYFVLRAPDLPVAIPWGADVTISIIERDRRGEKVLAQSPLRYRTI